MRTTTLGNRRARVRECRLWRAIRLAVLDDVEEEERRRMDTTDLLAKVKRAAGKHTLADLKACAIRESKQRRIAYPGMIYRGKINTSTAEIEQSRMAAIEAVLEVLCNADPQGAGRLI